MPIIDNYGLKRLSGDIRHTGTVQSKADLRIMFIGMHLRKYDEESQILPHAEEEMNDTALFFYESLPELRQRLSVGIA